MRIKSLVESKTLTSDHNKYFKIFLTVDAQTPTRRQKITTIGEQVSAFSYLVNVTFHPARCLGAPSACTQLRGRQGRRRARPW